MMASVNSTRLYHATNQSRSKVPMEKYEKLSQVGEGTYGKVYKAKVAAGKDAGRPVAMKKIRMETEKEGFPVTAVREIKLLKLLDHENIIKITDITSSPDGVSLIFEYFDYDLSGLLQHPSISLGVEHLKHILKGLLQALEYMHSRSIVHRDIKTSNILVGKGGEVKLADFGLAKSVLHPDKPSDDTDTSNRFMTNRVITLWYRPLEILLGATSYGPEVDMWSVGCVLVELFLKKPLFGSANSELGQIEAIIKRFPAANLSFLTDLPWANLVDMNVIECEPLSLVQFLREAQLPEDAIDLAVNLLQVDPKKRLTASLALKHPFMTGKPKPSAALPPIDGDWHEFECKQRRKNKASE